jgi:apolipoprotein N-acyltransferase
MLPVAQLASVGGVYAVSGLLVLVNVALALVVSRRWPLWRRAAMLVIVFGSTADERPTPSERARRNRIYLVMPNGEIAGHYDKQVLVPIGEYVPFARWLSWLRPMIAGGGPITPGRPTPLLGVGGVHAGVLVCYEAIVPWVAAAHAAHGAQVLLNLSNDGWYAGSAAPWQLLAQARFRAIEQGLPLVRVANGGPSAVVSATGRLEWVGPASGSAATVVPVRVRVHTPPERLRNTTKFGRLR